MRLMSPNGPYPTWPLELPTSVSWVKPDVSKARGHIRL